jgi:single-strand DNA-binding protein
MNLAQAYLIGKLTHDPELKTVEINGKEKVNTSFQLAVNSFRANQPASFFKIEAWDKQAEIICSYAKKGSELLIHGELKQEKWTNSNGENKEKVKIIAQSVQLGNKKEKRDTENTEEIVIEEDIF